MRSACQYSRSVRLSRHGRSGNCRYLGAVLCRVAQDAVEREAARPTCAAKVGVRARGRGRGEGEGGWVMRGERRTEDEDVPGVEAHELAAARVRRRAADR